MQSFRMALRSINSNKMRAVLTMLGIIIGVMALVVLVSIVSGATAFVADQVSSLGSDMINVVVSDDKGQPVTLDTLDEWIESDPYVGNASPAATTSLTGKYGTESERVTAYGITPGYLEIQGMAVGLGRNMVNADVKNNTRVCVINNAMAKEFIGFEDCIGEEVSLNGMKFRVVGVLPNRQSLMMSFLSMSESYQVYIPYTSLIRISDSVNANITRMYISPPEGVSVDDCMKNMKEKLLERFEDDKNAYSVYPMNGVEETLGNVQNVLSIMLGGIAAISLIVGGIGIMNIMMVTVTERTREIGVRKAIGASRGTILRQFLMEAVVLCMMGCGLGLLLSWSIIRLISVVASSLDISFTMNGTICMIAVGFCFLIGVGFGLYPANKAAKMKPIDALHYGG